MNGPPIPGNPLRMETRSWLLCVCALGLFACSTPNERADASTDAAVSDTAGDAPTRDAGPDDDSGGVDAHTPDALTPDAPGTDTGTATGCGSGPRSTFDLPRTCTEDPTCFDHPTCVEADRIAAGYGDHTPCGTFAFDASHSNEVCFETPPFADPERWPQDCGGVQYSGQVRFFCTEDSVAARFVANAETFGPPLDYFGHEYWAGSGGGSGDSRGLASFVDAAHFGLFGWQEVSVSPGSRVDLQVWFATSPFDMPGTLSFTGGFRATAPPE